jgi:hypothetical protein
MLGSSRKSGVDAFGAGADSSDILGLAVNPYLSTELKSIGSTQNDDGIFSSSPINRFTSTSYSFAVTSPSSITSQPIDSDRSNMSLLVGAAFASEQSGIVSSPVAREASDYNYPYGLQPTGGMKVSDKPVLRLNADTFQSQIISLSETLAQKVLREGHKHIAGPKYLPFDMFVLIRHAQAALRFFGWVNADEHRADCRWREEYMVMALASIRSIIDCLYIVLVMLDDPSEMAVTYRLSGFDTKLKRLKDEKDRYGSDPDWQDYLTKRKEIIRLGIRMSGFDPDAMPPRRKWITMGRYIGDKPSQDSDLQGFLRTFTLGPWREYSQVLHASFEGVTTFSSFYMQDLMPHEKRFGVEDVFVRAMTTHYVRATLLLLCIVTELQAYCGFKDARINERIHEVWDALAETYETKELYNARYKDLMQRKRIKRPLKPTPVSTP